MNTFLYFYFEQYKKIRWLKIILRLTQKVHLGQFPGNSISSQTILYQVKIEMSSNSHFGLFIAIRSIFNKRAVAISQIKYLFMKEIV